MKSLIFLAFWVVIISIVLLASILPEWLKHRRIQRENKAFLKKLNGRFASLMIESDNQKRRPSPLEQD